MAAHQDGILGVRGSNPLRSTKEPLREGWQNGYCAAPEKLWDFIPCRFESCTLRQSEICFIFLKKKNKNQRN